MLSHDTNQTAAVSAALKRRSWLFEVDTNNNGTIDYYWSTEAVTFSAQAYTFKIVDFEGIELSEQNSEIGLQAPNTTQFTVPNSGNTLAASTFENGRVTIKVVINDYLIATWKFWIKKCNDKDQTLIFECEDFLQKYLDGDYPNTEQVSSIYPSNNMAQDNLCVPVPFGTCYIPLRPIRYSSADYYLLGPSARTFTITAVHSPKEWAGQSEWDSSYIYTQTTIDATWKAFQPIIADSDSDGLEDACGLWLQGDRYLDMPTQFYRDDTRYLTSPEEVIEYVLEDFGIPSADIDTGVGSSFAAAGSTYLSWMLFFNGAYFYQRSRREILSELLTMCNSTLVITDKIEIKVFSKTSQKTVTDADILQREGDGETTFTYSTTNTTNNDSGYISFRQSGPQDQFNKYLVPAKSSTDNISSETLNIPFVQDSQNAQNIGCLYFQRKYRPATVRFTSKGTLLALQPSDVVTINDTPYGGNYAAIVSKMKINEDLSIDFTVTKPSVSLDDWTDLSFSAVSLASQSSTNAWQPVVVGPDSTELPNSIPGRLRIGGGANYIMMDPSDPTIRLYEDGLARFELGEIDTEDFGIRVNDALGVQVLKISTSGAEIAGWSFDTGKISLPGIELDSDNNRIRVFSGSNYVDITAAGITGYDSVLGSTFKLLTDGSSPEFSSGIIKECIYEIYTSGVIRTDANVASNGGLIINNTDMKGYTSAGLKVLHAVYDGTDQGDFYAGDFDSGNAGIKYDHSAGTCEIKGAITVTNPTELKDDLDILPSGFESGNMLTLTRVSGGQYSGSGTQTGAIRIMLPQYYTGTMIQFWVDVFDYADNQSFSLNVAGYLYASTETWANTSANIIGNIAADNDVRFGHQSSRCCVWIGTTSSSWSNVKVSVRDFQAGYSNYALAQWEDDWAISIQTSYGTVRETITDAFIDASSVRDQGTLATLDSADWQTQVAGTGKPDNDADVTQSALQTGTTITGGGIILSGGGWIKTYNKDGLASTDTEAGVFLGRDGSYYGLHVGDANSYIRYSSAGTMAIRLASGQAMNLYGGINVYGGGDIYFDAATGSTDAERGILKFKSDATIFNIASSFDNDTLSIYPDDNAGGDLWIGYDYGGGNTNKFSQIKLGATYQINIEADYIGTSGGTSNLTPYVGLYDADIRFSCNIGSISTVLDISASDDSGTNRDECSFICQCAILRPYYNYSDSVSGLTAISGTDFGSSSYRWRTGYFYNLDASGAITGASLNVGSGAVTCGSIDLNGAIDVSGNLLVHDYIGVNVLASNIAYCCKTTGLTYAAYWISQYDDCVFYVANNGAAGVWSNWSILSDEKIKSDIRSIEGSSTAKLLQCRPVTYRKKIGAKSNLFSNQEEHGLLAQELQEIYPELVSDVPNPDGTSTGLLSIRYGGLIAPIIMQNQEQQDMIDSIADRLESLERRSFERQ